MSLYDNFSTPADIWLPTSTNQTVTDLTTGGYFFRVRAIDDDGEASPWSIVVDILVDLPIEPPPPAILGFLIAAIVIGISALIGLRFLTRRRSG